MRWLLYIVSGMLAIILLLYGAINLPGVQTWLVKRVESAVSDEHQQLRITGAQGHLPFSLHAEQIEMADSDGVWLQIEQMRFAWNPWMVLFSHYEIKELTARRVMLTRLPDSTATEGESSSGISVPDIRVKNIAIDDVLLPREFTAGNSTRLRIGLQGDPTRLHGKIETIEGISTALQFDMQWQDTVTLKADLMEQPGGLLAHVLGLPLEQPINGKISVSGAGEQFEGSMQLAQATHSLVDAGLSRNGNQWTGEATGKLPAKWQEQAKLPYSDWRLELHAVQDSSQWQLSNTRLYYGNDSVTVNGAVDSETQTFTQFNASIIIPELQPWTVLAGENLQGALRTDATLDGPLSDLDIKLTAQSDRVLAGETDITAFNLLANVSTPMQDWIDNGWAASGGDIEIAAAIDGEPLQLKAEIETTGDKSANMPSFILTTVQGKAEGSVRYALETETLEATLRSRRLALAPLTGNTISGLADLDVSADGTLSDLALEGKGTIHALKGLPAPLNEWAGSVAELDMDGHYTPEQVEIENFTVTSGTLRLKAEGNILLTDKQQPVPLTIELMREGFAPVHADLAIVSNETQLRFPTLKITTDGTVLTGDGLAIQQDSGIATGDVSLTSSNIVPLTAWAKVPATRGKAELSVKLKEKDQKQAVSAAGTVKQLKLAQPELSLDMLSIQAESADVASALQASATAKQMTMPDLLLSEAKLSLKKNKADEPLAFALKMDGMQGATSLTLDSRGAYSEKPEQQAVTLAKLDARYGNYPIRLLQPVQFSWSANQWLLDKLALKVARGTLTAAGSVKNNQLIFDSRLERFPLRPLVARSLPSMPDAWLDTDLKMKGSPQQPVARLSATMQAGGSQSTPPLKIVWDSTLQNKKLTAKTEITSGEKLGQGELTVPANLSVQPFAFTLDEQAPLKGSLTLDADLAKFNDWLAAMSHKVEGQLQADMKLAGTLAAPRTDGSFQWRDGAYEHLRYGMCLHKINTTARLNNERIQIQQMQAIGDDNKGTLTGSGEIGLAGSPTVIQMDMANLQLFCSGMAEGILSGNLRAAQRGDTMSMTGKLDVGPLNVALPASGAESIPSVETIRRQELVEQKTSPAHGDEGAVLDISVNVPGRVFVRGRGLDAEFEGDLKLSGAAAQPRIDGKLTTRRGQFELLGSRLDIQSGSLRFLGEDPNKPYLDITATSDVEGVTVQVTMTGLVNNPTLKLSSTPALPQDEILARLLFGSALGEITPFQALQLAQAAAVLSGQSSGPGALGAVRNLIGVDTLNVNQTQGGDTSVGAGKYISDRVFVGVEQGATPESRKIKTEIEITPNISAETTTDAQGRPGGALEWKYDY